MQQILESKYDKQDLHAIAVQQKHLTPDQQEQLEAVLEKYSPLFSGKLGEWDGEEVSAQIKDEAKPFYCQRPIRIPHIHMPTLKAEIDRLVEIGVIEPVTGDTAGPWCAPTFIIPKKDGRVRVITDFRELNKAIIRRPWPMPHIADMIQDIGKYSHVTALDLSMGYYHLRLTEELSEMCTFMLPFGLYKYLRLPMGLNISPDVFQQRMTQLFSDKPFVKAYLDDLLVFSNGSYEDHLKKVEEVLARLNSKGMQVNARKSFWAVDEVDYLGFRLTKDGVRPQPKKVEAITRMTAPRNKKELRRFIGMVNYYRFMWKQRSHLMAPLAELTGKTTAFKWTDHHQRAFEEVKQAITKEVLLSFPEYTRPFKIYTDASDRQLGAVLRQGSKTLAFFSKKLNGAQQRYSSGEKEMLSVCEALKEFRTMIKGYPITVYTDHKNWTHDKPKPMGNARVMRWRLTIEEFAPTFRYLEGDQNVVADALSRLPFQEQPTTEGEDMEAIEDLFDMQRLPTEFYAPLTFKAIGKAQAQDKWVKQLRQQTPERLGKMFEDIGKKEGKDEVTTILDPVTGISRIVIPQAVRARLMEWYHTMLVHPGENRLYNTLHQHYTWPSMMKDIKAYLKTCDACQRGKRGQRGMGKLPLKDVETEPWKDIALDLAGPWTATIDNKKVQFHALTIVDTFTSWVEIVPIITKEAQYIRDRIEQEWLHRYPRPSRFIYDQGSEFDNQWFVQLTKKWYVNRAPITVKNPRANAIVERLHKIMGDMLRVQLVSKGQHNQPIKSMLSAAAYGIRAAVHGVTQYTPGQLVFGKDMILRSTMEANLELVRQRRQAAAIKSNERENKRRIAYDYKEGDQVLILSGGTMDPKLKPHQGPFKVLSFNKSNGTLHIQRNNYVEPINMRLVRPYFGSIRGSD